MTKLIPQPLIAATADICAACETHASLNSLFMYAGAPGEPPEGSKAVKAQEWLRRINKDAAVEPLEILGRIIENYMESDPTWTGGAEALERLKTALIRSELKYVKGGTLTPLTAVAAPSIALEKKLKSFDYVAVEQEFSRALEHIHADAREAVSAASNIVESVCKIYIHDNKLEMPAKQDIKAVWGVVRKHLGFDPSVVADQDLQTILTGMFAVVEGIGALRTHASSAHGAGRIGYRLQERHARLAINAAHTITLFILETWEARKQGGTL